MPYINVELGIQEDKSGNIGITFGSHTAWFPAEELARRLSSADIDFDHIIKNVAVSAALSGVDVKDLQALKTHLKGRGFRLWQTQ